jgi:hypothetical protein
MAPTMKQGFLVLNGNEYKALVRVFALLHNQIVRVTGAGFDIYTWQILAAALRLFLFE